MEKEQKKSAFETLNAINVNGHTEKKNGLTYLSWAWAWAEVKKAFPGSFYTVYENKDGLLYHTDGRTCWVKTGVTVDGLEHIEYLPVMDVRNRSIPLEGVTSMDVNKAVQRSLTKACARHGLGLYIYAGEDLPEDDGGNGKPTAPKPNGAGIGGLKPADAIAVAKGRLDACTTRQELAAEWLKLPEAVKKDPGTVRFSQEKAVKIKASEAAAAGC
jgi:hypothetical protein